MSGQDPSQEKRLVRLWFLFSNFTSGKKKGDGEFPEHFLTDQAPVAKTLMESQGLKEWQEGVTAQGVREGEN